MTTTRHFLYVRQPVGMPTPDCFRLAEAPMPQPADGEVLIKVHSLSIDPYFRRLMANVRGYANPLRPGDVMIGRGVGFVVESRAPGFAAGDAVLGETGWREHVTLPAKTLKKLDGSIEPLSIYVGALGQSGGTAGIGLFDVARLQPGETLAVSAAAGAVGSVVGQIGKIMGCPVVGIAGGPEKCRYVVEELGFDVCLDYRTSDLQGQLAKAAPKGIDVYFDNVGGDVLDAVLPNLAVDSRVAVCGMISQYNLAEPKGLRNWGAVLDKPAMIQGYRVGSRLQQRDAALVRLTQWYREGRLKARETVAHGLESAPAAFIAMLDGKNYGKQVVRL